MPKFELKPVALGLITLLVAAVIGIIELFLKGHADGTLLLTLTFFIALAQGSIAVVAAAEAAKGKWITPLKKELLSFYPLIAVVGIIFLFMTSQMDIYPWMENHHRWLEKKFFLSRNVIMIFVTFILAHFFARASMANKESRGTWAILYLFSFVTAQSLVAFDWVMSLEYPWMSTLFGGIFFMEAFYAGLALLGIVSAYLLRTSQGDAAVVGKVMRDSAIFMFGFALAWAGLFYAQYLVIWYGNIPFETDFFIKRMNHAPFEQLLWLHVVLLFIFPFLGLLAKKSKSNPVWVTVVSVVVLAGILVERIYYILPVVPVNYFWLLIEFALLFFLMLIMFTSREKFLGKERA